jgi:hypothetical protein
MSFDITSANAKVILTVENLYPTGVQLENFSTDNSFTLDDQTIAETHMSVDGKLTAGYTPVPAVVTINLDAGSPSYEVMSNIFNTSKLNLSVMKCSMQITVPALRKDFRLKNGVMTQGHPLPNGDKILGNTTWQFTFESCNSSSIS